MRHVSKNNYDVIGESFVQSGSFNVRIDSIMNCKSWSTTMCHFFKGAG